MCVAAAAAGDGWRVIGTDLGVNVYAGGERVDRRTVPERLTWKGEGWIAGSGEVRTLSAAFAGIEDPSDADHVRQAVREAAEKAVEGPVDAEKIRDTTNLLTATSSGVGRFGADGRADVTGAGSYWILTPPDYLNGRDLADSIEFNPDSLASGVNEIHRVLSVVAAESDVTAHDVSIGLLTNGGRDRIDTTVNGD